jgi:hypothetical protein
MLIENMKRSQERSINERAKHDVGFILNPDTAKLILNTEFISKRVMKITIRENLVNTTLIQVYSPCNATKNEEKAEHFFETINDTINKITKEENYIVMGDFNARIGYDRRGVEDCLGHFGDKENVRNENGCRLLELCKQQDLFITNTQFQHQQSHIYTWYKWNDMNCKSQIDFILARKKNKRDIMGARAIPNLCIDTDHKAVILTMRNKRKRKSREHRQTARDSVKTHMLRDPSIQQVYLQNVTEKYEELPKEIQTVEEKWEAFKKSILTTAKENCGQTKRGITRQKNNTMVE